MPVTLDPFFGFVYTGLNSMRRAMSDPVVRNQVRGALAAPARSTDGPVARLRQVMEYAELRPRVEQLVHDATLDVDTWCHGLRDA